MKNEEMINQIAEKVMKWENTIGRCWCHVGGGHTGYMTLGATMGLKWNPLENVSHAIMILVKLNNDGSCYSLINDDFGHWACVSDGIQPCEEKFEGSTTFFIDDKNMWADTIEMAICLAAIETTKD